MTQAAIDPAPDAAGDVTAALARFASALRYEALSPQARQVAGQCLLDWFGVTLAGCREPLAEMLVAQLREDGGNGMASVVGHGVRLSVEQAALANGAMSHALDYDDVHFAMQGHPTVPVAPAVLALGEWRKADGRALVQAFAAGFETECRVGLLMGRSHYAHGWHATATVGTIGAAAAAANLLGLDPERTAHAFGIAATQAAGLKSVFGTMCKPLHAGRAAAIGVQAARLAARGFTSNTAILDVPQGFVATQSTTANPQAALATPPGDYHLPSTLFKYHAACYLTHSSIEASARLRARHGVRPDDIARVVVRVDPGHLRVCNILAPRTGLETKFSLRATNALALIGEDTARESLFTDATAQRPDVTALRDRVEIETREAASSTLSDVLVHLKDGSVLREAHDVGIPMTDLDQQGRKLAAKFHALADPVIGEAAAAAMVGKCAALEAVTDAGELLRVVERSER